MLIRLGISVDLVGGHLEIAHSLYFFGDGNVRQLFFTVVFFGVGFFVWTEDISSCYTRSFVAFCIVHGI